MRSAPAVLYRSIRASRTPWRAAPSLDAVEALARRRCGAARPADKKDIPCWAPHVLAEGGRRRLGDVQAVTALVLDFDHLEAKHPAEVLELWAGYRLWAHETYSSRPGAHRARVVLPLAAPVEADAWRDVYAAVVLRWADGADPACSDPTRIHALPCRAEDGRPAWWCARPGRLLDLRQLAEQVRRERERAEAAREQRQRATVSGPRFSRSRVRLPDDPHELAAALGGVLSPDGTVVRKVRCPQCGRRDAWMPVRGRNLRCGHLRSCAYVGPPGS